MSGNVERKMQQDHTDETSDVLVIFPMRNLGVDVNDIPSNRASVTKLDIFFISFSILTHIVDVVFDLSLCLRYLLEGNFAYFYWTMAVLFIPSLINIVISQRMYNQDVELNPNLPAHKHKSFTNRAIRSKSCCVFILIFQLAPVLRHMDSLKWALKSRRYKKDGDQLNQRKYYVKMLKEDQDIALLRVIECFLEAAPQQVLQSTIMLQNYHQAFNMQFLHQVGSISSSLLSMGWALASYNRSIRLAQWDKLNIGTVGISLQFLWHFLITVSRIVSISAIASIWVIYTGVWGIMHWNAMTIWLLMKPSGAAEFCRDRRRPPHTPLTIRERIGSVIFAAVLGVVYIFTYLNPTDGSTFYRRLVYYSLCLTENVVACALWASTATTEITERWYFELVPALCVVPFVLGIISMVLYYKYFHPSMKTTREQNPQNS